MVSDAAKKKAAAKKLKTTAKLQGKDVADKQAAAISASAVREAAVWICTNSQYDWFLRRRFQS